MSTQPNTVIITGAGKGIGFELTQTFLNDPSFFVIGISRNTSRLESLNNPGLSIIRGDLLKNYTSIVSQIKQRTKTITHLINNAAQVHNSPIEQTSDEDLDRVMQTNFHAPYKLIRDLSEY